MPEAVDSSEKILIMFYDFIQESDFVGADMAKSFCTWVSLALVVTQIIAMVENTIRTELLSHKSPTHLSVKKQIQRVFYAAWKEARENEYYLKLKKEHKEKYGH